MTTRAVGPGRGWSWLVRAVNLGSHNARALFGAGALLLVIGLLPTVLQMLFGPDGTDMPSAAAMGGWVLFSVLYSVLVMPPAMAGFLRVIHASETGAQVHATAIFDGYRQGAGRIIGLVVVLMLIAIAVIAAVAAMFGEEFLTGMTRFMTAVQTASSTGQTELPPVPDGIGTLFVVLLVFGLFFNGVYALSVGQVALGGHGIGQALRDGFAGALKNVLPLLVLLVIAIVVGILAGIVVALLMGLLAAIGGLVHTAVAAALLVPVYLIVMLAVYVIAFGVMYFMWRDICADGAAAPPVRNDQLEV